MDPRRPLLSAAMQLAAPAGALGSGVTRTLVVAHRGAWGPAPQNSLAAFNEAIALGCDGIEIDVRRSADDRLVIVHDARIGGRSVARQDHGDLRARLRVGQAPLLEEVLELAAGRVMVDVELKAEGYTDAAMAAITSRLASDQYVVTSFRPRVLAAVRCAAPEAHTGLLIGRALPRGELERRVHAARVDFIAPHVALARRTLLDWAAAHGNPAWVWTVNDTRNLRRLQADPRVAAVITDRPSRALNLSHPVDGVDRRE